MNYGNADSIPPECQGYPGSPGTSSPPAPWDWNTCFWAAVHEHWDVLRWLRAEADPPCPWDADTEAKAKAHFGEAEVASWGGPPPNNN